MPVLADRVAETSVSAGNGAAWNLAGAKLGYQTFVAGVGAGVTTYYAIVHRTSGQWEVGIGSVAAGPDVLTRTTVLAGSAGAGVRVNFVAGTTDVFVSLPAGKTAYTDPTSGAFTIPVNTGIGTTTPTDTGGFGRALDLQGTNGAAIYLRYGTDPAVQYATIGYDRTGLGLVIGPANALPVSIYVNGVEGFRVSSSRDVAVASLKKVFLDGVTAAGDTYFLENAANTISFVTGGVSAFGAFSSGPFTNPTLKFFFDGGSDTYADEVSSNVLRFVVGGIDAFRVNPTYVEVRSGLDLVIPAAKRLYVDGLGDSYITESASNQIEFVIGGQTGLQVVPSATAGDVRIALWDVSAGAVRQVSRGAADSGGAGFRTLRIPN